MSSYIKFIFKYMFEWSSEPADELGELERGGQLGQLASSTSTSASAIATKAHEASQQVGQLVHSSALELGVHEGASYGALGNWSGGWLARRPQCLAVAQLLAVEARAGNSVRSLAELEALLGAQIGANRSALLLAHTDQLHDCFNQLQVHQYYAGYDILVGLRIASTLTILFVVFILFVIYKTNCAESQSSSLALPSVSERRLVRARKRERRQLHQHWRGRAPRPGALARQAWSSLDSVVTVGQQRECACAQR